MGLWFLSSSQIFYSLCCPTGQNRYLAKRCGHPWPGGLFPSPICRPNGPGEVQQCGGREVHSGLGSDPNGLLLSPGGHQLPVSDSGATADGAHTAAMGLCGQAGSGHRDHHRQVQGCQNSAHGTLPRFRQHWHRGHRYHQCLLRWHRFPFQCCQLDGVQLLGWYVLQGALCEKELGSEAES